MRLNSRLVVADACQYVKKGRKVESHIMFDSVSFKQLCLDAAKPCQLWHFGLPSASFSVLQHSNKGTRRWDRPEGDGSVERERLGNELLRRTCFLIDILEKHNNYWTLENLLSSYIWYMPQLVKKLDPDSESHAQFDQYSDGLRIRGDMGHPEPCKKPTRMIGNLPGLTLSVSVQTCACSGRHSNADRVGKQVRTCRALPHQA